MPEKATKIKKMEKTAPKTERYFEAVGRRKTAIARVRLYSRKGNILVNDKDYQKYFPGERLRLMVSAPLQKTNLNGKVEVTVVVSGGGLNSQAEAVRLGLARALVMLDSGLKTTLKGLGYLKRDPRMVERKKFGLKKARRRPQWAKR